MTLLEQIEEVWERGAATKAIKWAVQLEQAIPKITEHKKSFREWQPLRVYLSYTTATSSKIPFSLRYLGQEVATLTVEDAGPSLKVSPKTAGINSDRFGINFCGKVDWAGPEAREFRRAFRELDPTRYFDKLKSEEHHIESEFLRHMEDPTSGKFHGTFKHIQPVMMAGFPFQFPLPISGHSGLPKLSNGNIDILARRGTGGGTKISVWELKRPKTTAHAIDQAYIYAVTLLKMLRTPAAGDFWYKNVIGFGCSVPKHLTIESVVAVSISNDRNRRLFEEKFRKFKEQNSLEIGGDVINLHVAHYTKAPLTVELLPI
ncbi:hypothetical protein KP001_09790 [Geomonas subterranea]|uniref:PD-(D/E)XK endonuclease-like domain-containing protein n=1 Tax=Geomonas subterranea TaxID=2847989 RepID=A0ABX8LL81_9BACT|nr:hypothetical protein [Geomonas subterranea]QXE92781.1 hypothetical protein KP001_09790 [Geomonas subterranea]QXM09115.1 hypothetical protein KP002_19485 [Geomonas subterranea]